LANDTQVHYFIEGLDNNAVRNTNLNLHMLQFYESKPTATVTDLYAEANKVISLSASNRKSTSNGQSNGQPSGFRRNRRNTPPPRSKSYDGRTQSKGGGSKRQRPSVTYGKCHRDHATKDCRAKWSKTGVWLGQGQPPVNHHWTRENGQQAADATRNNNKQKQAATVKTTKPKDTRQRPVHSKNDKGKGPHKGPELQTRFAKALSIDNMETVTSDIEDAPPLQDSTDEAMDEPAAEDSFTSATEHTAQQWKSCMENDSDLQSDSEEEVDVRTVQSSNEQVPEPSAQARGTYYNQSLTPYQQDLHSKAYHKQKKSVHFKSNRG
jgi:hypothetical protein